MDVKVGEDSKGVFAIVYGPNGVRWLRGATAQKYAEHSGFGSGSHSSTTLGYLSVATDVINAVARLGQWYEMHQMRLLEEAQFEERRINWLVSCVNLVLNDMHANSRLNAKAAFYLSREAEGLYEVCEKNSKVGIPGTVLFMCHEIRQSLAEFNIASYSYLSDVLNKRGNLGIGKSIYRETLGKILGDVQLPSDASWLEYYSAEDQLEAMLGLVAEKKSIEINWKDIAKSAVLLAAFVPTPIFWASGVAMRVLYTTGTMSRGAVAAFGIQPLIQIVTNIINSKNDSKQMQLIGEYHDLLLLRFEAANTARLLSVQERFLEATGEKNVVLIGKESAIATPQLNYITRQNLGLLERK